jgi:hypothetical protein
MDVRSNRRMADLIAGLDQVRDAAVAEVSVEDCPDG